MTVKIYTTNTCAYCGQLKKWLSNKGVEYTTINLDEQPEKREEAFALSGAFTVPVTLIEKENNKQVIVGLNLPRMASVIG